MTTSATARRHLLLFSYSARFSPCRPPPRLPPSTPHPHLRVESARSPYASTIAALSDMTRPAGMNLPLALKRLPMT
jgi:hypothetical protein